VTDAPRSLATIKDRDNGFRFGLETEFLLVDAVSFCPLWHPDLQFATLSSALEAIPVDDLQCDGLKIEPPHRKSSPLIYTCPMHPQIRQVGPGSSPICGMALEPELATVETGLCLVMHSVASFSQETDQPNNDSQDAESYQVGNRADPALVAGTVKRAALRRK